MLKTFLIQMPGLNYKCSISIANTFIECGRCVESTKKKKKNLGKNANWETLSKITCEEAESQTEEAAKSLDLPLPSHCLLHSVVANLLHLFIT